MPSIKFRFSRLKLALVPMMLVEGGCDESQFFVRWLVAWNGSRPYVLAVPKQWKFDQVQRHATNGFHDFTMFDHTSMYDGVYTWYRFDGKSYRPISSADVYFDTPETHEWIAEEQQRCRRKTHRDCHWVRYSGSK